MQITGDRRGVVFIRSAGATNPAGDLWWLDLESGREQLLAAATSLLADDEEVPAAERVRRERLREGSAGITAFSVDADGRLAAFALSCSLFTVELPMAVSDVAGTNPPPASQCRELAVPGPVADPRLSPDGSRVGWHCGGRLWLARSDGSEASPLTPDDGCDWGRPISWRRRSSTGAGASGGRPTPTNSWSPVWTNTPSRAGVDLGSRPTGSATAAGALSDCG